MGKRGVFSRSFWVFMIGVVLFAGLVLAGPPRFIESVVQSTLNATEDSLFSHNLTANVTDYANYSSLTFSIVNISSDSHAFTDPDLYYWISLNLTTGIIEINATLDNETGILDISTEVLNGSSEGETRIFNYNVSVVNDAPEFLNLGGNRSVNKTGLSFLLGAFDEENNFNISLNATFESCPGGGECDLFNLTAYNETHMNLTFYPTVSQKGTWTIRFNATDSNGTGSQTSVLRTWNLTWNDPPHFTYACDNERNTTEGQVHECLINVSDRDGGGNWTLFSNESWFVFQNSSNSSLNVSDVDGNFTALINFTGTDAEVGNWSINISVNDQGIPVEKNSTVFYFFIGNVNDSVGIEAVENLTIHNSTGLVVFRANATDDDLLILDKSIYNESLTFFINNTNFNLSEVARYGESNKSYVNLTLNPRDLGVGNYSINVSVRDFLNFSVASSIFTVEILANQEPVWNSVGTNHSVTEANAFSLNLSANVSDGDGDSLNFSFALRNSFPAFKLNATTGVVNITANDSDVGEHLVDINVTDGKSNVTLLFNFTVSNVNENPVVQVLSAALVINATVGPSGNVNTTEDNRTTIEFRVEDEDFRVPSGQKGFYNESLSVGLNIQGVNTGLFNFTPIAGFPTEGNNLTRYQAIFTPNKTDVGDYNVTLTFTDSLGLTGQVKFNLTVINREHNPSLIAVANQSAKVNSSFYYDINATDIEDVSDLVGNMTYSYNFMVGEDFIRNNESVFNTSTGVLSIYFNDSHPGAYRINVSVNDSTNLNDSTDFWVFVYDNPEIQGPNAGVVFNLGEGNNSNLSVFVVNHSAGTNLTYNFLLDSKLRASLSLKANATNRTFSFTPNFTDETYGDFVNLSLFVFNPDFPELNASRNWSVNITHGNAPANHTVTIPDQETTGTSISLNLTGYFDDADYNDVRYNQSVNFTVLSNASAISSSVSDDWILTFSGIAINKETFNITLNDLNSTNGTITSDVSNNFKVSFVAAASSGSSSSSGGGGGGGGGGGSRVTRNVLELDLPDPVLARKSDKVLLPIGITSNANGLLDGINLVGVVSKDGEESGDITVSFDKQINSLVKGQTEIVNLVADVHTEEEGTFVIEVKVSSDRPKHAVSGKVFVEVDVGKKVEERILFAEEFVIGNPECLEIKELIDEAQELFDSGDEEAAEAKVDEAISGCRNAISGQSRLTGSVIKTLGDNVFGVVGVLTLVALGLGIGYYSYRRYRLMRVLQGY